MPHSDRAGTYHPERSERRQIILTMAGDAQDNVPPIAFYGAHINKQLEIIMSPKPHKTEEFKGILIMFLAVLSVGVGQICFKLASFFGVFIAIFGIVAYFLAFYFTLVAYRFGRMSVLFPLSAFSFVITTFAGIFFFHEIVTTQQIIGLFFILLGIILVSLDAIR